MRFQHYLVSLLLCALVAPLTLRAQTAPNQSVAPAAPVARLKATLPNYRGPSDNKATPAVLVFSPDNRLIAIRTADKTVALHEVATGKLIAELTDLKNTFDAFAFSPDGRLAATRYLPDKSLRLWDTSNGKPLLTLAGHTDVSLLEKARKTTLIGSREIIPVAFSPDGKSVLTEQDNDFYTVYDTTTGEVRFKLNHDTKPNKGRSFARILLSVYGLSDLILGYGETMFSPDGRVIVTVDNDKFPKVWDATSGKLLHTLEGHGSEVYGVQFSPDGRALITLSVTGTMKLWDVETGALRRTLDDGKHKFIGATWSPRSDSIALWNLNAKEVWIVSATNEQSKLQLKEKDVRQVIFSPDGSSFATFGRGKNAAKVWDTATGKLSYALPRVEDDTKFLCWSPNGRILVTSSNDSATLWNAADGTPLQELGERARYPIRFSPDGRTLATGSKNDVALLWEIDK